MILKLCGAALIAAAVALLLRRSDPGSASLTAGIGLLLLLTMLLPRLREAVDFLDRLLAAGHFGTYGGLMLKTLGIGVAVKLAGDLCRESGAESLAGALETAGRIEILLLCLPLFTELLDLVRGVLG